MTVHVLLLEDEHSTRELLARALTRQGYEVTTAADGKEAEALLTKASDFDVIVTDVVIGSDDRGGLRFLAEVRRRAARAPVIVITAFADFDKVKTALNEGASYLLEKPFRAPELIAAIERVRQRGSGPPNPEIVFDQAHLTEKERVVGRHLLAGYSSEEIATLEQNSPKTIRQHITQVYAKCGVASRAEFFRLMYSR